MSKTNLNGESLADCLKKSNVLLEDLKRNLLQRFLTSLHIIETALLLSSPKKRGERHISSTS